MDGATSAYLAQVFGVAPILVLVLSVLFGYTLRRLAKHEGECAEYRKEMRASVERINASLHELIGAVKGVGDG